jgi:membrane-associated HD superfamily phosphohydrolase
MRLALNFLIVLVLCVVVYFATVNAAFVRQIFNLPLKTVAGAKTQNTAELEKEKFTESLTSDAKKQLNTAKDQILEVKLRQVVDFFGRAGKIVQDIKNVQKGVTDTLENNGEH